MAKGPTNDSFITTAELKQALNKAYEEPIPFAISMSDGDGLLLAAKKGKPKKLQAEMLKEAKQSKLDLKPPQPFFGRASAEDGKITFKVNKMPPATFRPAILKLIKPLTYTELEFLVDEAVENESEDDQAQADAAPAQPTATPDAAVIPDAPPPPPPPVDMAAFKGELAALIPQIMPAAANDAARADLMKKAAGAATLAVRGNDPAAARTAIDALKQLIGQAGPVTPSVTPQPAASPAPAAPAPGKFVVMQKSRLIWDSARKKVGSELQTLKSAVSNAAKGDAEETAILGALNQLDDVMTKLDERLLDKLDDLLNTQDPAIHATLLQEAKGIIGDYVAYTQSSQLVQKLDGDTPFGVKLSVASTMAATLKALQATIV